MKVKQRPEDFRVEEITPVVPGNDGPHALYRLDKTGWTTPDALAAVRRSWQIDHSRLSYGGLKDRHAVTAQFFSIFRGPKRNLKHQRITVAYLGQVPEPYSSANISANRFAIVVRSLSTKDTAHSTRSLAEVNETGLPNYFDDQRFGSVGQPPEFVAKEMVLGSFERALWLALAAPYEFDRREGKAEKATLREHWKNWTLCKSKLPRGHARSLVDYLVHHPDDFKGAVARLRPELQGLYLSAYQSYLWNRMLGEWLTQNCCPGDLGVLDLKLGVVPVPLRIAAEMRPAWQSLALPLPSARIRPEPGDAWAPIAGKVLQAEGLTLAELKVKGMQKPFFSKGLRAGCIRPENLAHVVEADELNAGREKLILKFDLPRGSYATMLVKRVTTPLTSPAPGP